MVIVPGRSTRSLACMRESAFGFSYSWSDLQPVRALAVTALVAQLVGAGVGVWVARYPEWFDNLWAGGAIATFPGYAIGLLIQHRVKPGSLTENLVMVRRMGLIALVLTLAGFIFPPFAGAHAG
jgi:hypothetical protein